MKLSFLLLMTFLLSSVLVPAQNASKPDEPNDLEHKRIAITGCLTKNSHKEFEIVDEKGIGYRPYSATVNLNQYVGQIVTLTGRAGATHRARSQNDDQHQDCEIRGPARRSSSGSAFLLPP